MMLVRKCRVDDVVEIANPAGGEPVKIKVIHTADGSVKLGIDAPGLEIKQAKFREELAKVKAALDNHAA